MRFVCSLWRGKGFWKEIAKYDGEDVKTLASMLDRHGGHKLTCIHDGTFEIPDNVSQVTMPRSVSALPDYQPKLWAWSKDLHEQIGERFAHIDLDVVILADLSRLIDTDDNIIIWDEAKDELYNTSLFVLTPGHGNEVWERLSPSEIDRAKSKAIKWTGDQSFVAYVLGSNIKTFSEFDGVLRFRPNKHRDNEPKQALAVFFCGPYHPKTEQSLSNWVLKHWN